MKTSNRHAAFTLVELLIVIAIIAVLAALSVSIIRVVLDSQQKANTEAAMRTVYKTLQQHWAHVVGEARKEVPSPSVLSLAGGDPRRAQVIWVKLRLVEAFPQSYDEVGISSTPAWQNYVPAGNRKYNASYKRSLTGITGATPEVQAATCLLLALGVRRGGAGLNMADLGPAARDSDGDGLKELVDGWGRPIAFIRFPVGIQELQDTNPARSGAGANYCDPLDPEGQLLTNNWANPMPAPIPPAKSNRQIFEELCHRVSFNDVEPRSAPANYIIPVLQSQGNNPADPGDDIVSFTMRQD